MISKFIMNELLVTVPIERIEKAIFFIRGQRVMLDRELARLYGVSTFRIYRARNLNVIQCLEQ